MYIDGYVTMIGAFAALLTVPAALAIVVANRRSTPLSRATVAIAAVTGVCTVGFWAIWFVPSVSGEGLTIAPWVCRLLDLALLASTAGSALLVLACLATILRDRGPRPA